MKREFVFTILYYKPEKSNKSVLNIYPEYKVLSSKQEPARCGYRFLVHLGSQLSLSLLEDSQGVLVLTVIAENLPDVLYF